MNGISLRGPAPGRRSAGWGWASVAIVVALIAFSNCASPTVSSPGATLPPPTPAETTLVVYHVEGTGRVQVAEISGAVTPAPEGEPSEGHWRKPATGAVTVADVLGETLLPYIPQGTNAVIRVDFVDPETEEVSVFFLDSQGVPLAGGKAAQRGSETVGVSRAIPLPEGRWRYGMEKGNLLAIDPLGKANATVSISRMEGGEVVEDIVTGSLMARYDLDEGGWQFIPEVVSQSTEDERIATAIAGAEEVFHRWFAGGMIAPDIQKVLMEWVELEGENKGGAVIKIIRNDENGGEEWLIPAKQLKSTLFLATDFEDWRQLATEEEGEYSYRLIPFKVSSPGGGSLSLVESGEGMVVAAWDREGGMTKIYHPEGGREITLPTGLPEGSKIAIINGQLFVVNQEGRRIWQYNRWMDNWMPVTESPTPTVAPTRSAQQEVSPSVTLFQRSETREIIFYQKNVFNMDGSPNRDEILLLDGTRVSFDVSGEAKWGDKRYLVIKTPFGDKLYYIGTVSTATPPAAGRTPVVSTTPQPQETRPPVVCEAGIPPEIRGDRQDATQGSYVLYDPNVFMGVRQTPQENSWSVWGRVTGVDVERRTIWVDFGGGSSGKITLVANSQWREIAVTGLDRSGAAAYELEEICFGKDIMVGDIVGIPVTAQIFKGSNESNDLSIIELKSPHPPGTRIRVFSSPFPLKFLHEGGSVEITVSYLELAGY